ncbi:BCCT family transporter, partial [Staphylococcus hominis]|uniref:BCCT family transporter n=1 Tax=Staphylococcus hominis TaxID=1290 RepID=UPI0037096B0A
MLIFPHLKFIFQSYTLPIPHYLTHFLQYTLRIHPYTNNNASIQQSTLFYSPSVISSSPFIRRFLAPLSPPPTIPQFIISLLILPPLISFVSICPFPPIPLKIP